MTLPTITITITMVAFIGAIIYGAYEITQTKEGSIK